MKVSKTVDNKVKQLYALLATAAAKKAVYHVEVHGDGVRAEHWAEVAADWLATAGAEAATWHYQHPKVS